MMQVLPLVSLVLCLFTLLAVAEQDSFLVDNWIETSKGINFTFTSDGMFTGTLMGNTLMGMWNTTSTVTPKLLDFMVTSPLPLKIPAIYQTGSTSDGYKSLLLQFPPQSDILSGTAMRPMGFDAMAFNLTGSLMASSTTKTKTSGSTTTKTTGSTTKTTGSTTKTTGSTTKTTGSKTTGSKTTGSKTTGSTTKTTGSTTKTTGSTTKTKTTGSTTGPMDELDPFVVDNWTAVTPAGTTFNFTADGMFMGTLLGNTLVGMWNTTATCTPYKWIDFAVSSPIPLKIPALYETGSTSDGHKTLMLQFPPQSAILSGTATRPTSFDQPINLTGSMMASASSSTTKTGSTTKTKTTGRNVKH